MSKIKEFHIKSFEMCKLPDSFVTYILAEDAIDVLEATLNFLPSIAKNFTTISLLKFLKEQVQKGSLKAFKKDEWTQMIDFVEAHKDSLK